MGVHSPSHTGAVHQNLQHGTLLVVRCDNYNRKLRHDTATSPTDFLLAKPWRAQSWPSRLAIPGAYLLPPDGFFPSNLSLSRNGLGSPGPAGGWLLGAMRCTVHNTINSVLLFCRFLLLNKLPRIGMSPIPGILLAIWVRRLSMRPAITKLCPSCSSNSVSARRVLIAGTLKPEIVSPLAKSS